MMEPSFSAEEMAIHYGRRISALKSLGVKLYAAAIHPHGLQLTEEEAMEFDDIVRDAHQDDPVEEDRG